MGFSDMFKNKEYQARIKELEAEVDRLNSLFTPEMRSAEAAIKRKEQAEKEVESLQKAAIDREERAERKVASLQKQADDLMALINEMNDKRERLDAEIRRKRMETSDLDDEIAVQEFGLYHPRFDFASSSQYKDLITACRAEQKAVIKRYTEELGSRQFTLDGNLAKGRQVLKNMAKLLFSAYNSECDDIVRRVKTTNVVQSTDRVRKRAETLNRSVANLKIAISQRYINLKVEEVQLAYEFARAKEWEREEQRRIKAEEREQKKLEREIAEERKRLEKERKQYKTAYDDVIRRCKTAEGQEKTELEAKAIELREKLEDVDAAVADVDYREANQKAGYVYIISNIGSFGEGIYKIGMTRRLDPMERVRELSDASVPFNFDVHALIFCDDAPALEAALHREFADRKVNMVNQRREFFRVSLEEIEAVVKANYDRTVEFIEVADAEQWRVSEKMREQGLAN